ncbi:site-specific integrase [Psychroflexus sp. ALD_RP9]|uniref:site-specific integrase n=1 Tax=Psychroflexus sp. ALD_RP9 TaxID=2777186 RepID=UPI001A9096C2|nr:site-specific integrase [Psychroflexus sp. ALD_RP9]QSS97820.1 site-specific integrase [Psychroflexus sp. ALD_RP9]
MSVKLRKRKLSNNRESFYLDIYHKGKRYYENLDIVIDPKEPKSSQHDKRNIAKIARSEREVQLISSGYEYMPSHNKKIKFFDYAEAYLDNYTKKDVAMIDAAIKRFKDFVSNNNVKLSSIQKNDLLKFTNYLANDCGLKGETPQNYFARLKKIFKDAHEHGFIVKNPTVGIKFSKSNTSHSIKKNVLNEKELKILYNTPCEYPELKRAFLFACNTGLGLAEIHKLKWENLKNGSLNTKREKTGNLIQFRMNESILSLVGEPKEKNQSVFNLLNDKQKPLTNNGANFRLKVWLRSTNIDKDITFYCARHTFATQLLLNNVDLKTVSDLLGHSDLRSTTKYLNFIGELKNKAIDKLPNIKYEI